MSKKKLFFIALLVAYAVSIIYWLIGLLWSGAGGILSNIIATVFFTAVAVSLCYLHYLQYEKKEYMKHAIIGFCITVIAFLMILIDIWFSRSLQGAFLVNAELFFIFASLVFLHNGLLLRVHIIDIHIRYVQVGTMVCASLVGIVLLLLPNFFWNNNATFLWDFLLLIGASTLILDIIGVILTTVLNRVIRSDRSS